MQATKTGGNSYARRASMEPRTTDGHTLGPPHQWAPLVARRASPHSGLRVRAHERRAVTNGQSMQLLLAWMLRPRRQAPGAQLQPAARVRPWWASRAGARLGSQSRAQVQRRTGGTTSWPASSRRRTAATTHRSGGRRGSSSTTRRSGSTSRDDGGGSEPGPSRSAQPRGLRPQGRRAHSPRMGVAR